MQDAPSSSTSLPANLPACHALLAEQSAALMELQAMREQLAQENNELNLTIQKLLARLRGHRSERHDDPAQQQLDFGDDPAVQEGLTDAVAEQAEVSEEVIVRRKKQPRKVRNEQLPEHLPRYEVVVDPTPDQEQCAVHGERQLIGYDITETLEFERPKLRVRVSTASWMVYRDLQNETYSGQGYALGTGPEYEYTLVNPVSIQQMSHDGRTSQSITAVRDCAHEVGCDCLMPDAGMVESPGRLAASDCFPQSSWIRWSVSFTNDQGQATSSQTYHNIPASGTGAVGINYDETRHGYDLMGRQNRSVSPTATISRTVFDVRGLPIESWLGTDDRYATDDDPSGGGAAGNNMVQLTEMEYDGGSAGGDGYLTEQTAFVDETTERVTAYTNDFRGRRVTTDGEVDYFEELFYDNLNHVINVDRRNTTSGGNLIARSETLFDDRGRVYRTIRYGVNPTTGTVGESLVDNTWYDKSGNALCSLPSGSNAFTKSVYDGIGRVPISYAGYNPDAEITPDSVAEDKIFEQSETDYDSASNVLLVTSRQRWHNATGLGALNGPSGSQPKSRDSFVARWADGVGRTIASANYGTNDNAGPPERPEEPPESSDLILVSRANYNERGEAFESIDPAGKVDRSYSDNAGRTVRTIQNYVALSEPGCFCPGSEQNVTTEMRYGSGSQRIALIAKNPDTGDQITRYEYGVTLSDSDLASNDLLRAEVYPDSADSADRVTFRYNRQGQRTGMRDQNGNVHDYAHDLLGRQLADAVTTIGPGVDDAILRIGRTYEVRGMVEKITSYDAAGGGSVVNEVENAYNDFAQLATQYQEHAGAVNTGTSQKVEYAYEDGSANTIRPTTMTYPSGQVLENLYDNDDADNLSRIRTLNFDGDDVCRYTYLGLSTFVTTDYLQPEVKLDYATGSDPNPYTGFDQFGRIIDLLWQSDASSSSSSSSSEDPPGLVHLQCTYDRASNRISRTDLIAQWYDKDFDELYEYDGMHRLKKFHRGRLVESETVIESPTLQQGWRLDAIGNWRNFTQNDQADHSQNLDQQRLSNRVNEITAIARTVGSDWVTPEYDRNGNMTDIPQPKDPTLSYRGTWDAWNRLTKLEEPDGSGDWQTLQENTYDGQTWRIIRKDYEDGPLSETRHFYYTRNWQDIEERLAGETDPKQQYVWGRRYIDDLILRDRDTDVSGSLDERLYALQDGNWNVVALATHTGTVVERYSYQAYGSTAVYTDEWIPIDSLSQYANCFRYSGYWYDLATALYLLRSRYFDSSLGCFVSRDPITAKRYEYAYSRPLTHADPSGLIAFSVLDPWKLDGGALVEIGKVFTSKLHYHVSRRVDVKEGDPLWDKRNGIKISIHFYDLSKNVCGCKSYEILQLVKKSHDTDATGLIFIDNGGRAKTPFYSGIGETTRGPGFIPEGYAHVVPFGPNMAMGGAEQEFPYPIDMRTGKPYTQSTVSIYDAPYQDIGTLILRKYMADFTWMARTCVVCKREGKPDVILQPCVKYGYKIPYDAKTEKYGPAVGIDPATVWVNDDKEFIDGLANNKNPPYRQGTDWHFGGTDDR